MDKISDYYTDSKNAALTKVSLSSVLARINAFSSGLKLSTKFMLLSAISLGTVALTSVASSLHTINHLQKVVSHIVRNSEHTKSQANSFARLEEILLEQEIHFERALRHLQVDLILRATPLATNDNIASSSDHDDQKLAELEYEKFKMLLKESDQISEILISRAKKQFKYLYDKKAIYLLTDFVQFASSNDVYRQNFNRITTQIWQDYSQRKLKDLPYSLSRLELVEDELTGSLEKTRQALYQYDNRVLQIGLSTLRNSILINRLGILWIFLGFALGILITLYISIVTTKPLNKLNRAMTKVVSGDLDLENEKMLSEAGSGSNEILQLSSSFLVMVDGLKERNRLAAELNRYVDPRILEELANINSPLRLGARSEMTVGFLDIVNFTDMSNRLTPGSTVKLMNEFFDEMVAGLIGEQAVIDKFIGDSIMSWWGPPFVENSTKSAMACRAMLDCLARLDSFNQRIPELLGFRKDVPQIKIRMGVATGIVLMGNIGSENRKDFTVTGDTVNLASRLEGICSHYYLNGVVDQQTHLGSADVINFREIDTLCVKGIESPITIYEPLGVIGKTEEWKLTLRECYAKVLMYYRQGDWALAKQKLDQCFTISPDDGPSKVLAERVDRLASSKLEEWDGVWRFTTK